MLSQQGVEGQRQRRIDAISDGSLHQNAPIGSTRDDGVSLVIQPHDPGGQVTADVTGEGVAYARHQRWGGGAVDDNTVL